MKSERRREYARRIVDASVGEMAPGHVPDCPTCEASALRVLPILEEMIREQARGYFQGCLHGKPFDETCDDCDTELTT